MIIDSNDQRLAAATATQIQQTGRYQIIAPKPSQQQDPLNRNKSDFVQPAAGDTISIKVELPQNTVDTLKRLGNTSDILNSLAINLRQTNEGLAAANTVTEKMKATLDKVIKDYPPYPVEDKGRMEQLMGYSGLRKQLQTMMIPTPPAPLYEKVQHLWEGLTGGVGSSIQTPSLPQNAPSSHVSAAAKQHDVISGQISLVQETMSSSVMRS